MARRTVAPGEIEAVLVHYDVGALTGPPEPGGGTANFNLRIITASGAYFLRRRNPEYADDGFVAFDHALMEHLARYEVKTPRAVATRDGKRWVRTGADVYELCHYREGGPHDRHSAEQLAAAGRALAGYHRAARDFPAPAGKDWSRYDDPRLIRGGIEAVSAELARRLGAGGWCYLMSQVSLLERELPDERYHDLPKLVIHGDYHPGNLKFVGDEVSGIFDLDWATLQPRARDLADGVFLFAGERESDIDDTDIFSLTQTWRPSAERASVFMSAYLGPEALAEDEMAALPLFVRARWLYCRVAGMVKVTPERRIEYFTAGLLEPLRALDGMERLF